MNKSVLRFLSLSLLSIVISLIFIAFFVNSTDAACQLQSDGTYTCRISKSLFGKYQVSERVVKGITDVTIKDDGCNQDGCFYRLEFIRNDGSQEPFNNVYTDLAPVRQQRDFFRSQITSHAQTFTYHIAPPWWILLLTGGLDLSFMVMLFFRMKRKTAKPDSFPN